MLKVRVLLRKDPFHVFKVNEIVHHPKILLGPSFYCLPRDSHLYTFMGTSSLSSDREGPLSPLLSVLRGDRESRRLQKECRIPCLLQITYIVEYKRVESRGLALGEPPGGETRDTGD